MEPRTCAGCGGRFADFAEHLAGDNACPAARDFQRKISLPSRHPREGPQTDLRCPKCGSGRSRLARDASVGKATARRNPASRDQRIRWIAATASNPSS